MQNNHPLLNYYRAAAYILLNFVLIFLVVNICLAIFFAASDHFFVNTSESLANPDKQRYIPQKDLSPEQHLAQETWDRPLILSPYVVFHEKQYAGRYINVNKQGIRSDGKSHPWPPDPETFNVFLFGGSTTFGYGVKDQETIASFLQQYLSAKIPRKVSVYNFGCAYYFSSLERILYENMLIKGIKPEIAVFVDGLNEFYYDDDEWVLTQLREQIYVNREKKRVPWFAKIPLVRFSYMIKNRFRKQEQHFVQPKPQEWLPASNQPDIDHKMSAAILHRYLENKKMIEAVSQIHGVHPVFVWQPVPTYHLNVDFYPFKMKADDPLLLTSSGYPLMEGINKKNILGKNFIWAADIQSKIQEQLYVDRFHYSVQMSRLLAEFVGQQLLEREILTKTK